MAIVQDEAMKKQETEKMIHKENFEEDIIYNVGEIITKEGTVIPEVGAIVLNILDIVFEQIFNSANLS